MIIIGYFELKVKSVGNGKWEEVLQFSLCGRIHNVLLWKNTGLIFHVSTPNRGI
jgi:hypothetical protein